MNKDINEIVNAKEIQELKEHLNKQLPVDINTPFSELINKLAIRSRYYENKISASINDKDINNLLNELTYNNVAKTVRVFPPIYFDCAINISIGENTFINHCCHFQDHGGITIGKNCYIGPRCNFETLNHSFNPAKRGTIIPKPIIIKDNVWIGANVTILQGVTIEENSIIAAGAVVTKNVPSNSVYAGVPAKLIKKIN